MDIQGIREGALFAMYNMQDVWSFLIYRVFLLAGMPACYIYRQQEGRHQSRPKAEGTSRWLLWMLLRRSTSSWTRLAGRVFCEELMARMDEDALDAVCDRIAPRYGVELAGSRYAA